MEQNQNNIEIQLLAIKEVLFSCKSSDDITIDPDNLQIRFGMGMEVNNENKSVNFTFGVEYLHSNKKLLESRYLFIFEIDKIENTITMQNDSNAEIKDDVLLTFVSVAVGTMRGILTIKTVGNVLNNYPLPIIDVRQLTDSFLKK